MLLWGMKICQKIAGSEPLSRLLIKPFDPPSSASPEWPAFPDFTTHTEQELEQWVRRHVEVLYHPVGTVRLGPAPSESSGQTRTGCLDEQLRVHGTRGLRVCDASIFPEQLSGHPVSCESGSWPAIIGS